MARPAEQRVQSAANATAINAVLASTHVAGVDEQRVSRRRAAMACRRSTRSIFRVQMPPAALSALRIELVPCVVWPATRPLPDPSM